MTSCSIPSRVALPVTAMASARPAVCSNKPYPSSSLRPTMKGRLALTDRRDVAVN